MIVYVIEYWETLNMSDDVLQDYEIYKDREAAMTAHPNACLTDDSFFRFMDRNGGGYKLVEVEVY